MKTNTTAIRYFSNEIVEKLMDREGVVCTKSKSTEGYPQYVDTDEISEKYLTDEYILIKTEKECSSFRYVIYIVKKSVLEQILLEMEDDAITEQTGMDEQKIHEAEMILGTSLDEFERLMSEIEEGIINLYNPGYITAVLNNFKTKPDCYKDRYMMMQYKERRAELRKQFRSVINTEGLLQYIQNKGYATLEKLYNRQMDCIKEVYGVA